MNKKWTIKNETVDIFVRDDMIGVYQKHGKAEGTMGRFRWIIVPNVIVETDSRGDVCNETF